MEERLRPSAVAMSDGVEPRECISRATDRSTGVIRGVIGIAAQDDVQEYQREAAQAQERELASTTFLSTKLIDAVGTFSTVEGQKFATQTIHDIVNGGRHQCRKQQHSSPPIPKHSMLKGSVVSWRCEILSLRTASLRSLSGTPTLNLGGSGGYAESAMYARCTHARVANFCPSTVPSHRSCNDCCCDCRVHIRRRHGSVRRNVLSERTTHAHTCSFHCASANRCDVSVSGCVKKVARVGRRSVCIAILIAEHIPRAFSIAKRD